MDRLKTGSSGTRPPDIGGVPWAIGTLFGLALMSGIVVGATPDSSPKPPTSSQQDIEFVPNELLGSYTVPEYSGEGTGIMIYNLLEGYILPKYGQTSSEVDTGYVADQISIIFKSQVGNPIFVNGGDTMTVSSGKTPSTYVFTHISTNGGSSSVVIDWTKIPKIRS